jgi:glucokinase
MKYCIGALTGYRDGYSMGILSIDFGGTRTRTAWYNAEYKLIRRAETRSLVNQPADQVIGRIISTAREVVPAGERIERIGIAAPGPLDAERGIIHHAHTLPGWRDTPLRDIISEAFGGVLAFMENDATLAAYAEYRTGAGRDADPMLYLTISTGIGGGAILNGKVFTGWSGLAIEPGHIRFTLPDGSIKRLEELASGTALGEIARQRLQTTDEPSLLRDLPMIDGAAVGEGARVGDAFALSLVQEAGTWLGLGLVNVVHLFSPRAIVLGGSVALRLGDLLLDVAREVLEREVLHPRFLPPDLIRLAQFGDDVCLLGAALAATDHRDE